MRFVCVPPVVAKSMPSLKVFAPFTVCAPCVRTKSASAVIVGMLTNLFAACVPAVMIELKEPLVMPMLDVVRSGNPVVRRTLFSRVSIGDVPALT